MFNTILIYTRHYWDICHSNLLIELFSEWSFITPNGTCRFKRSCHTKCEPSLQVRTVIPSADRHPKLDLGSPSNSYNNVKNIEIDLVLQSK